MGGWVSYVCRTDSEGDFDISKNTPSKNHTLAAINANPPTRPAYTYCYIRYHIVGNLHQNVLKEIYVLTGCEPLNV